MKHPNKKQSLLLAALAVAALTLGGVCVAAEADAPAAPPTPPPAAAAQPDGPKAQPPGPNAAELRAKVEKFMEDSKALRKELFVVDAAFKAQSRANQPNDALVRELAGRLFDLKDQLRSKARERGLPPHLVKALTEPGDGHRHGPGHHHQHGAAQQHGPGHHHHHGMAHQHGPGHQHGTAPQPAKAAQSDKKGHQHGMGCQHGHGGAGGHHENCECEGHGH